LYCLGASVAPASRAGEQRFEELLLVSTHLIGLQGSESARRPLPQ
jgi:hypothetical protein